MRKIQDVPIWYNGENKNASWIYVNVSEVNLGISAKITYSLYAGEPSESIVKSLIGARLQDGALVMDGQAYQDWGNDDDYVWEWISAQLNIVYLPNE